MAASDDDEPDMESKAGGPKKLGRAAKRLVAELSTTFAGKRKSMTLDEFADTVSAVGLGGRLLPPHSEGGVKNSTVTQIGLSA